MAIQCWKRPVARWSNAPKFHLGPPEISKLETLVAQIYISGYSILFELDFQLVAILGH